MGWSRNMYDRLVHLAYGLLLYPLFSSLISGLVCPHSNHLRCMYWVIQFVMATSLFMNGLSG